MLLLRLQDYLLFIKRKTESELVHVAWWSHSWKMGELGMVMHVFHSCTLTEETGGSLWIRGQPGLYTAFCLLSLYVVAFLITKP